MTLETKAKLDIISQAACSYRETLYFSYEIAKEIIIDEVPGDFVECGVYAGAQCAAMALACQELGADRKIHLFDSFEGIPKETGPNDDPQLAGESVSSIENTQHFMELWGIKPDKLVYHKGWFCDTIPVAGIEKIAILRLDGDLEESYRVCLNGLYPALVEGGFCILDDFALTGCRIAIEDYVRENRLQVDIKAIEGGHGPAYFRKS